MKFFLPIIAILSVLSFINCFANTVPGALIPIEVDKVKRLIPTIEDHIRRHQHDDGWIYVDKILKASSQIVSGEIFEIDFSAIKTDCLKNDPEKNKKTCEIISEEECSITIYEKAWENLVEVMKVKCMGIELNIN